MRIWLLTSQLPPEIVGGIARYVDNFARLLGAAGHEVLIITRSRQVYDQQLAPGVRVIGLKPLDADLDELIWPNSPATHHLLSHPVQCEIVENSCSPGRGHGLSFFRR